VKWSDALGFQLRPPKLQDPLPGWLRNGPFFHFGRLEFPLWKSISTLEMGFPLWKSGVV
jgi:hypothetical protein